MRFFKTILIFTAILFAFCGCDLIKNDDYLKDVSYLQNYYFLGESDNYIVEMKGGKRETNPAIDGSCGKLVDSVKIKVTPKNAADNLELSYKIGVDEADYSGKLIKEVIGDWYKAEISTGGFEDKHNLFITSGDKTETVVLRSVITKDMISYMRAREIAEEELKNCITALSDKGTYEVYIKFVEGEEGSGVYYWYVAFLSEDAICACLISPQSGKVVAKRTN